MLRLFKSDRPSAIVLILFMAFLLWAPELFSPEITSFHFDGHSSPLYFYFQNIHLNNPFLSKITGLLFNLITAFLLVRLNTKYFFISVRTQLPALIYIFLVSSMPSLQRLTPVNLALLLFILAVERVMSSYKYNGTANHFFDASMLVAISSMIYFPVIFFMPVIWAALIILRPFNWREWMFTIIGLLVPFLFLFTFYYWTDEGFSAGFKGLLDELEVDAVKFSFSLPFRIFLIYLSFLIVIGSFFILKSYETRKIQIRKYFLIFLILFLLSVLLYLITRAWGNEILFVISIPLSFLLSHYFVFVRTNFINNLFFILFILGVFIICYYRFIEPLLQLTGIG